MKFNIKKVLLIPVFVVSIFALTACENKSSKLVGTWLCDYQGIKSTYVFDASGKGSQKLTVEGKSSTRSYTYKTKDNKLLITFDDDKEFEFSYGYRFDNDNLVLKDSSDEEFTCKKK